MFVQNTGNGYLLPHYSCHFAECSVKRVICKAWTGTLANSADPDWMLQNAASDQDMHCLLKLQEVKG